MESTTLLPGNPMSVTSGIFNTVGSIVGAGVVTLPFAFSSGGYTPALFLLLFCGYCSFQAIEFLIHAADQVQEHTFLGLVEYAFGTVWGRVGEVWIGLATFSSSTAHVILLADSLPVLIPVSRSYCIFGCCALILFPLSVPKRLRNLYLAGFLAILSSIMLGVLLCIDIVDDKRVHVQSFQWKWSMVEAVPLFAVAFLCHFNILTIFQEMGSKQKEMLLVARMALWGCILLFGCIGLFGYLRFGRSTQGDVVKNLDSGMSGMMIRWTVVFSLLFNYPLVLFALRKAVTTLVWPRRPSHVALTGFLVGFNALVAWLIPRVDSLLGYSGALFGTPILYVIPPALYLKTEGKKRKMAYFMIGLGISSSIVGVIVHTLDLMHK